ncbi:STAS domain-containing protein [Couchioplanes azureus]|uniref:STAS domain-containing protein n=1 Tax=Couchioplanes caeruleus TaxID=56438 RepID=UPI0016710D27|nr:STAS domain-containing protein [Couchioplanes caeruleus]GGQ71623.1 hypothetical protein GCM10010166_47200 [Couchioplanes caeruleus subsp. azureus]
MTPTSPVPPGAAGITTAAVTGDRVRLTAVGEFDRDNQHLITTAVRHALDHGASHITLDAYRVTFLDAATVATLQRCQQAAAEQHATLHVSGIRGLPATVLSLTDAFPRLCPDAAPPQRHARVSPHPAKHRRAETLPVIQVETAERVRRCRELVERSRKLLGHID